MTPDVALEKRNQLIKDGYCVVDNILTQDLLEELRRESDRMLDAVEHPPHWKYQGSDLHVGGDDEPVIDRLIHWQLTRSALEEMGLGDFESHGGFIILSKPPGGAAPLLAPRLDGLERPNQHCPVAPVSISLLLPDRHHP